MNINQILDNIILYNDIIKNTYNCDNNSFILHNFGKNNDKLKCFEKITQ